MGRGMAANLLNKTFAGQQGVFTPGQAKPAFVVYDAHPPALSTFLDTHTRAYSGRDVLPASAPAGVARMASTIVTMLPSRHEVDEVYCGENGIFEALEALSDATRRDTLLIDCTTGDREHSVEVARRAADLGVDMVDAPVSGGVVGADKGTLSFMVGGSEQACVLSLSLSCAGEHALTRPDADSTAPSRTSQRWARASSTAARPATACASLSLSLSSSFSSAPQLTHDRLAAPSRSATSPSRSLVVLLARRSPRRSLTRPPRRTAASSSGST